MTGVQTCALPISSFACGSNNLCSAWRKWGSSLTLCCSKLVRANYSRSVSYGFLCISRGVLGRRRLHLQVALRPVMKRFCRINRSATESTTTRCDNTMRLEVTSTCLAFVCFSSSLFKHRRIPFLPCFELFELSGFLCLEFCINTLLLCHQFPYSRLSSTTSFF